MNRKKFLTKSFKALTLLIPVSVLGWKFNSSLSFSRTDQVERRVKQIIADTFSISPRSLTDDNKTIIALSKTYLDAKDDDYSAWQSTAVTFSVGFICDYNRTYKTEIDPITDRILENETTIQDIVDIIRVGSGEREILS